MILKTKYFDIETDSFSFKEPESIRERIENRFKDCFINKPITKLEYDTLFKISLKYEPTPSYFRTPFPIYPYDLIFSDVGHIEGYKIMNSDYTCHGFHYEPNHTYSIEEEPILCERGFHFCKKLADCFNYYLPWVIDREIFNLDCHKYFKVKSNGTTYLLGDKYCTNNITILEECSTEEILEALNKWLDKTYDYRVKLRGGLYLFHDGIYHKIILDGGLNNL